MEPERVVIVGAGIVGLSTAYFLQERGVEVTVVDRIGVAAGASWGNAGWLAPALTVPLPEPAMIRYGAGAMFRRDAALSIPRLFDPRLIRFLTGFTIHSAPSAWRSAMAVFTEMNRVSMDAFDELTDGTVDEPTHVAEPLLNGFVSDRARDALARAFDAVLKAGGEADYDVVDGDELRAIEPVLSDRVTTGLRLHGQRYIDPPRFVDSLARAVRGRGGDIIGGFDVTDIRDGARGVEVRRAGGASLEPDGVVIANGAWLGELARPFGVRQPVQPGKGYSFSVVPETMPTHPIDFPGQHVACTPLGDRFRISGVMELSSVDQPFDRRRLASLVTAVRPMLTGIDWEDRREEWFGSRPCTPDGLPLIGPTRSPRVFVAGGHGMWGVTLGPLTGRYLASAITGGPVDPLMRMFDPLR